MLFQLYFLSWAQIPHPYALLKYLLFLGLNSLSYTGFRVFLVFITRPFFPLFKSFRRAENLGLVPYLRQMFLCLKNVAITSFEDSSKLCFQRYFCFVYLCYIEAHGRNLENTEKYKESKIES